MNQTLLKKIQPVEVKKNVFTCRTVETTGMRKTVLLISIGLSFIILVNTTFIFSLLNANSYRKFPAEQEINVLFSVPPLFTRKLTIYILAHLNLIYNMII